MEAKTTRFMLTVPNDMANRAETLKKDICMQELEKEAKEKVCGRVS